jgi:hypothetical protein
MANPYEELGVQPDADPSVIRAAYRRASMQHHPDRKGGDEDKFKKVNRAFEILSDPEKRAHFDKHGEEELPTQDPLAACFAELLQESLATLIDSGEYVYHHLPKRVMRSAVKKKLSLVEQCSIHSKGIEKVEAIKKRLKHKNPEGVATLLIPLNFTIDAARKTIKGLETQIEILDRAIAHCEEWDYEVDIRPEPPTPTRSQASLEDYAQQFLQGTRTFR